MSIADQVTKLTEMLVEQKKVLDSAVKMMNEEREETKAIKQEVDALTQSFAAQSAASAGGGNQGNNSAPSGGGGANQGQGRVKADPIYQAKMDACPQSSKDQSMREWTEFAKSWARGLPPILREGEGRYRVHNAIGAGLTGKSRVKTTWMRLLKKEEKKYEVEKQPFTEVKELLDILKEMVIEEEKTVAQEEFKIREIQAGETYSEYKMVLFSLGGIGYEDYSESQLADKVLDRFIHGCGEAGPSVRLQAPKNLEDAITKAIAYDNEKNKSERASEGVFAFGGGNNQKRFGNNNNKTAPFKGMCFNCNKRGHKSADCWSKKSDNNEKTNQPTIRCFSCQQEGHKSFQCPNKKKEGE